MKKRTSFVDFSLESTKGGSLYLAMKSHLKLNIAKIRLIILIEKYLQFDEKELLQEL